MHIARRRTLLQPRQVESLESNDGDELRVRMQTSMSGPSLE